MPHLVLDNRRLVATFAIALIPLLVGCPSSPAVTRATARVEQEDALGSIRDTVRKDHKLDACKTAVAQMNLYLARPNESKPQPVSETERELLAKQLGLNEQELKEAVREKFSPLDAYYLDECFLLHDAIRGLKLDWSQKSDAAQLERARLGFAWTMRQVWLRGEPGRPLPPAYALRMGSSSVAERSGIALAMFRLLGLDAGVIGSAKEPAALRSWALGVRIGGEVYLFDPRGGEPIAAANRQGIATLRQARATPELVKEQIAGVLGSADTKAAAAESRVWLSPALSSLSARMRWLQSEIVLMPPIVLGVDPVAQAEAFAKAGETIAWWSPPGDVATPTRLLGQFIPDNEGGFDHGPAGQRYFDNYLRPLIPMSQLPELLRSGVITGVPALRLNEKFASRFLTTQVQPGEPRDMILRGQFDDANNALIGQLGYYSTLQKRIASEGDLDADARKWAEAIVAALGRHLKLQRDRAPESEVQAALERVKQLDKESQKMGLLIERSAIEPHSAVLTFLLAQSKHEQAERLSRAGRDDAASVRDAWQTASGWWRNFIGRAANASWVQPAQVDHAKKMLADLQTEIAKTPAAK